MPSYSKLFSVNVTLVSVLRNRLIIMYGESYFLSGKDGSWQPTDLARDCLYPHDGPMNGQAMPNSNGIRFNAVHGAGITIWKNRSSGRNDEHGHERNHGPVPWFPLHQYQQGAQEVDDQVQENMALYGPAFGGGSDTLNEIFCFLGLVAVPDQHVLREPEGMSRTRRRQT